MNKVRITAIRQTVYEDLMAKYETPIEHTFDVVEGQQWISVDGKCPEGMCPAAWYSMREFVESLTIEVKSNADKNTKGLGGFRDKFKPKSAFIVGDGGISAEEFLSMDIRTLFK